MNNQKIYGVQDKNWGELEGVYAFFSSREKAKDFIARFKTKQNHRIIEVVLNPEYISDKFQNPYLVDFRGTGNVADSISICSYIDDAEDALAGTMSIEACVSPNIEEAYFSVKVFARTKKEATTKAIKIRDKAIARGVWHREHQKALAWLKTVKTR